MHNKVLSVAAMALVATGVNILKAQPGSKQCTLCVHKQQPEPGLHCFMFKEEPTGDACGQFKAVAA